jgi:hypothetical protein
LDRVLEAVRRRVDVAAVQVDRRPAGSPCPAAQMQQQCGLADAARPVHEEHPTRRSAAQCRVEGGQFPAAADEPVPPPILDDVTERRHDFQCRPPPRPAPEPSGHRILA